MATTETRPLKGGLRPMHPGELLRETILPGLKAEQGIGPGEFAERLGVTRQHLGKLTREVSGVTPEMALRLGRVLGTTPQFWLNLQQAWDLAKTGAEISAELAALRPVPRSEPQAA